MATTKKTTKKSVTKKKAPELQRNEGKSRFTVITKVIDTLRGTTSVTRRHTDKV